MSTMRDAPILKAVADVIKAHVGKALGAALTRIDAVEGRLNDLPAWFRKDFVIPKGEKGDRGDDGRTGEPGAPGVDGRDGASGADGTDGAKGETGDRGEPGRDGKDGADGKPGDIGPDGTAGKDGAPGQKGLDGKDGINGKDGADGLSIKGDIGPAGKDGRDGIDGKDAPPIDTKALADEVTQKVLGQIPPPVNGKDGKDAELIQADIEGIVNALISKAMPEPIHGKDGRDGKDIDAEALNVRIASEVSKAIAALPKPAAGRDGRDGRVGEAGESGKDALDLDIINGIDETVSYQRGVFAKHRNGLFRAYRTTDPVIDKDYEAAGWMCVVAGVVDVVEAPDQDQRTIIRSHELSDGSLITTKYKTPSLIYRGVFKEGQRYEVGDAVTNAGAMWMCGAATIDKPGISKDWTLAVKRGSDGKDLRPKDDEYAPNGKGSVYLGVKR